MVLVFPPARTESKTTKKSPAGIAPAGVILLSAQRVKRKTAQRVTRQRRRGSRARGFSNKENNTTLTANEEIVRLQRRIKELEKENLENIKVKHTLKELAECATIERESFGKVGRNRIPAQRVTFNLRLQWALLFELGVTTGLIMIDKTEFINTAVRLHLEYHYPQLYALYIRSITRDEQNELPSDHPPPYL